MKLKTIIMLSAFGLAPSLLAIDFTNFVGQRITPENEEELYYTSIPYAIARQGQRSVDANALVVGFAELEDRVFSISTDIQLLATRKNGRAVINNWPLTRWAHEYLEPNVESSYADYFPNPYSRDYIDDSDRLTHLMGCMQRTPLRYGDVTGDGQSELVALLADPVSTDILLFSPSLERIIFSAKLNFTDFIPRNTVINDSRVQHSDYQFVSWRNFQLSSIAPAMRAYAKLYVGDFDESGQPDMIVWRKQYDTRRTDDAVEGFILSQSTWLHYTLVDGEYQPVETDESTIQGWLSAQNLTWSQGFPSLSECAGEEGQLIPEMHDPLLNDPDVLQ